jgi:hypothetical protein
MKLRSKRRPIKTLTRTCTLLQAFLLNTSLVEFRD